MKKIKAYISGEEKVLAKGLFSVLEVIDDIKEAKLVLVPANGAFTDKQLKDISTAEEMGIKIKILTSDILSNSLIDWYDFMDELMES